MEQKDEGLLILKANATSMKGVEIFLKNREWKFISTHLMKETIQYLMKYRPKYMLLPADHPNPKVRMLPKVLQQALGVVVIGYTESNTSRAANQLASLGLEYNLYPPVSGPQIIRFFAKVQKQEEEKRNRAKEMSRSTERALAENQAAGKTPQIIHGQESAGSESQQNPTTAEGENQSLPVMESGQAPVTQTPDFSQSPINAGEDAQVNQLLSQLLSGKTPGQTYEPGAKVESGEIANLLSNLFDEDVPEQNSNELPGQAEGKSKKGGLIIAKGGVASGRGIGYNPNQSDSSLNPNFSNFSSEANNNAPTFESGRETPEPDSYVSDAASEGRENTNPSWQPAGPTNRTSAQDESTGSGANGTGKPGRKKKKPKLKYDVKNEESNSGTFLGNGLTYSEPTDALDGQKKSKGKSEQLGENVDNKSNYSKVKIVNSKFDTIILKGSVEALDKSVRIVREKKDVEKIDKASQIACMIINSPRFKGYLITAFGKNRKLDEDLTKLIRQHLIEFLKAKGEILKPVEAETMSLDVKSVSFQAWANDQAEFLLESIHDDNQVALAFFPTEDINVNLENSAEAHMLKMDIGDIADDMPLDFDIFIHLPANGKYIRYNKEGQRMFGEQKERLIENGVTHIHLNKDSEVRVKKYKAKNYLNAKIAEFERRLKKTS